MERKAYHSVFGSSRLVVTMEELDVHVLIEGSGQAVAWAGQNTPPPTALGREGNCRVLGGIAQSEDGERFKGAVDAAMCSTPPN